MSIVISANPIHITPQYADRTQTLLEHIQWPQVEEHPRHIQTNRQTRCKQGHKRGDQTYRDNKSARKQTGKTNHQEEGTSRK